MKENTKERKKVDKRYERGIWEKWHYFSKVKTTSLKPVIFVAIL